MMGTQDICLMVESDFYDDYIKLYSFFYEGHDFTLFYN